MIDPTSPERPNDAPGIADDISNANAIASLSQKLEKLEDARSEERFIWVVSALVAFDAYIFSKIGNWSGPIVIGIIQFVLLTVLARKLGIQEVDQVLAKLLDRAADVMPRSKSEVPAPPTAPPPPVDNSH